MHIFRKLLMAIPLLGTWLILVFMLSMFHSLILVPWDAALTRPEVGNWQRTLNDFFEGGIGRYFIYTVMTIVTILPIVQTLYSHWTAGLRIIVANLLFVILGYCFMLVSFTINNIIFPVGRDVLDPFSRNYTRTIIPLLTFWFLYSIWFREIKSLSRQTSEKRKMKAKNTDYESVITQLTDSEQGSKESKEHELVAASRQITQQ